MSSPVIRAVWVLVGVAVVAVALFLYIDLKFAQQSPSAAATETAGGPASLTLATAPAVGSLGGEPTWVSYLKRNDDGSWDHTAIYELPGNSLVKITIYQFDSPTGLRNPYLSQVQGTVGGTMRLDGKTVRSIDPEETAHTFNVPELGIIVPLPGVAEDAPDQCQQMPCSLGQAHHTIEFTIRTPASGQFRWQCFVPCAAGFVDGNGGPMQTVGYMDGYLKIG